ncbi:CPBP family intramembrane metalloprotease [Oscillibacter valericigenes]|nr:CPBP family intramembrane metalloprotease [Oscillibacter valericigenes]
MTSIKKNVLAVCALVLLGCAAMTLVDGVLRPPYAVKSAVKLALFLLAPLLYGYAAGKDGYHALFRIQRRALPRVLALGFGVFALILGAYFALRSVFDFSAVTALLGKNAGVTAENFLWVSLYISFVNSLLEEFFFRGFAFLVLRRYAGERFACVFSALSFALYHTAMMLGWFSPLLFLLALAGLTAGGVLFNLLDARAGTIFPSWAVHIFANLAINTVGFILFKIL